MARTPAQTHAKLLKDLAKLNTKLENKKLRDQIANKRLSLAGLKKSK